MSWTSERAGLTISAVSSLLAIPVPTIRSWERRYGFPVPARTDGRHRRYSTDEIDQLRALRDEITRGRPTRDAVEVVRGLASASDRNDLVSGVVEAAIRLDPAAIRTSLAEAAEALGVERAICDVALPAMREMGSRWKAGVCDTAHEHLASEAVRVWLARQSAMVPAAFRPFSLVLACGPRDLHTIGLEAFGVILARRGWPIRTLGSQTRVSSLVTAVRASEAGGAVISSHRSLTRRPAVESIVAVHRLPGVQALYGGAAFSAPTARRGVPGVYLGEDIVQAAEILERSMLDTVRVGA